MITLRQGCRQDLAALEKILVTCGMRGEINPSECLGAEEGRVAGFGRIDYADGVPYLRPIVTAPESRGHGIGRQLLEALVVGRDEVRVVARGEVAGFYRSCGFVPMAWDSVYVSFREECAECPDRASCKPIPMRYRANLGE